MQKIFLLTLGVLMLAGGVLWYFSSNDTAQQQAVQVLGEPDVTIVRTKDGYEPNEITIKKGDIVLWTNESGEFHWPASDLHPTHGVYPEFDPKEPIAPDGEWKFQFNQEGVWKFHDHIRANKTGTITVTN